MNIAHTMEPIDVGLELVALDALIWLVDLGAAALVVLAGVIAGPTDLECRPGEVLAADLHWLVACALHLRHLMRTTLRAHQAYVRGYILAPCTNKVTHPSLKVDIHPS